MSKAQKKSRGSSPLDAPRTVKGERTKPRKLVRYTIDSDNPPPLTDEQRARLEALAKMSDEDIDFSDIPATTEKDWEGALRGIFSNPPIRLDSRVVEWFQERIGEKGSVLMAVNHVLLDHIAAEKKKARKKAG